MHDSPSNPESAQLEYLLRLFQKQEAELSRERQYVPILLGNENDVHRASWLWLAAGIAVLSIEFFLGFQYFAQILRWSSLAAAGMTVGLISALSMGVKLILDHFYRQAQAAATAARRFVENCQTQIGETND